VRLALEKLQQELTQLESSADLYAEEYAVDADLQALTDRAIVGWAISLKLDVQVFYNPSNGTLILY
jgi:hypothetical protein